MRSPSIFIRNLGFSLVEVMIAISIIGVLAVLGVVVGLGSFSRYNFYAEVDKAVSLLSSARSKAMNNIGRSGYGVYFGDADSLVLFKGAAYGANPSYDFKVEKSKAVSYDSSACAGSQMVFSQLSGSALQACQVVVSDGVRSITITLNNEGGINW